MPTQASHISRRALVGGAVAGLAWSTAGSTLARAVRRPYPLGMTDATIRPALAADFAGTMRALKNMDYTHFGFRLRSPDPRDTSEPSPADKAKMVRDAGLEVGVVRFTVSNQPIPTDPQIEIAQSIGAKVISLTTAPIFLGPDRQALNRAKIEAYVPELDQLGAKVRAAGMTFVYHNHDRDHFLVEGVRPLDLFAAGTDPRNVSFEVDLAWAFIGGVAPLELVQSLGKRVVSMHLKDVVAGPDGRPSRQFAPPGGGMMNYAALLPRLRQLTDALGLVEVDNPADGMAAAAEGARFVRRFWKA